VRDGRDQRDESRGRDDQAPNFTPPELAPWRRVETTVLDRGGP
jgi:hypothetical protein